MIVATAVLGQTDGSVAAIQRLRALRPPPQTYSSHIQSNEARWVKCLAQGHNPNPNPNPKDIIYNISISQICVFIYKIHSTEGNIPEHFRTYFEANSHVHSHSTRQSSDFHPPKFLNCRGQFAIRFRGTKSWNGFPYPAKNCSSIKCYERNLNDHLTVVL